MKSFYHALLAACLFLPSIASVEPGSSFEFRRDLKGEPSGETLGIALLDSDVFRELTGDLSDVRIFDESETEARLVPF
jgi:hypothetical protein